MDPRLESSKAARRGPRWGRWALGCGGFAVLAIAGTCCWLGSVLLGGPEGGVRYANDMESYALAYNESHGLLNPDEQLVAYFDVTMSLDATEAAILTDQRLIYHRAGRVTSIPLTEIVDVHRADAPLGGDLIDVTGADGTLIHIEIPVFNGGAGFARALELQRRIAAGEVAAGSTSPN